MREIEQTLLEAIRFQLALNGNEDATMLVDKIDEILCRKEKGSENEKLDKSMPEPDSQVGLVDYLDEFIQALRKQLHSDFLRWGNTWRERPKEGQEMRTMYRYDDYFDMFRETGEPVPWMKIVGNALICWIREQHPELCPDVVAEFSKALHDVEEGTPDFTSPDNIGVAEITSIEDKACTCPDVDVTIRVLGHAGPCKDEAVGIPAEGTEGEKAIEDMTTKELVELSPYPVAHVRGEVLNDWRKGVLAYSPKCIGDGKLIRESVIFTTWTMGKEILLAKCDRDGFISRGPGDHWIEGTLDNCGKYVISTMSAPVRWLIGYLSVSYDYVYFIPEE